MEPDSYNWKQLNKQYTGLVEEISDIRKYFFTKRIIDVWIWLNDDVVIFPSIIDFKKKVSTMNFDRFLTVTVWFYVVYLKHVSIRVALYLFYLKN